MSLASSWLDTVIGLDIHLELVPAPPAPPIPTPLPLPFVGLINDPVQSVLAQIVYALAQAGVGASMGPPPVFIGSGMASVTGDRCALPAPHLPMPPGMAFVTGITRSEADLTFGSLSVLIRGASAIRMGELAMSCSDPVPMPTANVMALANPTVIIGGPPAVGAGGASGGPTPRADFKPGGGPPVSSSRLDRARAKSRTFEQSLAGDPVNVATGHVVAQCTDVTLPGDLPFAFVRQYSSNWCHRDSPLGRGWSHSYDQKVWLEAQCVVWRDDEGREVEFDTFAAFDDHVIRRGQLIDHPAERATLRCLGNFCWEIERDALIYVFSPVGGDVGQSNPVAKLREIRRADGQRVTLRHDDRGDLVELVDVAKRSVRFEYKGGKLWRMWLPGADGKGHRQALQCGYSSDGDLIEVRDALGSQTRYTYVDHLLVQATDRDGHSFHYEYEGFGSSARCTRTWGDQGIHHHVFVYDPVGRSTLMFDSAGHCTLFEITRDAQVAAIVDPTGAKTTFEYDALGRRTAVIDPHEGKTTFTYDDRGNIVQLEWPGGAVLKAEYDAKRRLTTLIDPLEHSWSWAYDSYGRVTGHRDPLGRVERYLFDKHRLAAIVHADGQQTRLTHDEAGNVVSETSPIGATTQWRCDALGRVVNEIDPIGAQRRWGYDGAGRLMKVERSDGDLLELARTREGRVARLRDRVTDQVARMHAGRLLELTLGGDPTTFRYDLDGRVTAVEGPGRSVRFERGVGGQLDAQTMAGDEQATLFQRDALGRVVFVRHPDGGTTAREYDAAGNLTRVDHDGVAFTYVHDARGDLIRAEGPRTRVELERDAAGRIVKETQAVEIDGSWVESTIESRYDVHDQRVFIETSQAASFELSWAGRGQLSSVVAKAHGQRAEVALSYNARGDEVDRRYGDGLRSYWWRDAAGRPTQHWIGHENTSHRMRKYVWGAGSRCEQIDDALDGGSTAFGYDEQGRWRHARRGDEVITVVPAIERGPLGQPIGECQYDGRGRLVAMIDGGAAWHLTWDGADRLIAVERPDGVVIEWVYDALGRRVLERVGGQATRWVWDRHAMVHECPLSLGDPSDSPLEPRVATTWVFGDGWHPLARLRESGAQAAISDHHGAALGLFTRTEALPLRRDARGHVIEDRAARECPWRDVGHYADHSTGLHYNRMRYYDPKRRAYLSRDPLGVNGQEPVYGYEPRMGLVDALGMFLGPSTGARWAAAPDAPQQLIEAQGPGAEPKVWAAADPRWVPRRGPSLIVPAAGNPVPEPPGVAMPLSFPTVTPLEITTRSPSEPRGC